MKLFLQVIHHPLYLFIILMTFLLFDTVSHFISKLFLQVIHLFLHDMYLMLSKLRVGSLDVRALLKVDKVA